MKADREACLSPVNTLSGPVRNVWTYSKHSLKDSMVSDPSDPSTGTWSDPE